MRSPLSNARGLGSAGEGLSHWWMQRITSVALAPLSLWFGFSLSRLPDFSHATVTAWIQHPLTTILLVSFLITGCYHMALGLRVIVEDYVTSNPLKITTIVLLEVGSFAVVLTGIVAVMKIFV